MLTFVVDHVYAGLQRFLMGVTGWSCDAQPGWSKSCWKLTHRMQRTTWVDSTLTVDKARRKFIMNVWTASFHTTGKYWLKRRQKASHWIFILGWCTVQHYYRRGHPQQFQTNERVAFLARMTFHSERPAIISNSQVVLFHYQVNKFLRTGVSRFEKENAPVPRVQRFKRES